ncbi:unnamed protein product [Kluyveromyces dobzhanskii CBS 2104]|uniref:WGS project CCBQ000000000 data, contig 00015 n=1 Tax=Kluyveromyces dobzhanskii CBS 2104 TaxID=1427455 RepID=A0A0A8L909_9SACH|nr:unnamed protein product [Kluyveromyces dobzhanskii CBS 2104]
MAPLRQDSYFIIYPGSTRTLVQFGIGEDTLQPPSISIPTKVYRDANGEFTPSVTDDIMYPIEKGSISDIDAFQYFLKLIYKSVLKEQSDDSPIAWDTTLSNIPFLLISHHSWTQQQQELLCRHAFEAMKLNHFVVLPSALATSFAYGSLQNCLVMDIGKSHTDIIPIVDYTPLTCFIRQIAAGGDSINLSLKKLLPNLTESQIDALKKSDIYEILSQDILDQYGANNGDDDEGALDVATIVTSGRDTREILEERERNKTQEKQENSKLETNDFLDIDGNRVTVGRQRFSGYEDLIKFVSKSAGQVMSQIDDITKLKAMWENVVIVGGTSHIKGFREALLAQLIKDHIVAEPEEERNEREREAAVKLDSKQKK